MGLAFAGAITVAYAQDSAVSAPPDEKKLLEIHRRALEALHGREPSARPEPAAAPKMDSHPASAVPAPDSPALKSTAQDEQKLSEIHRRALEALHAGEPQASSPAMKLEMSPSNLTDKEAEGRARLMLHQEQREIDSSRPKDAYQRDLEMRTRSNAQPASTATQPANVEVRAQELLRQQKFEEKRARKSSQAPAAVVSGSADNPNAAIHARALQALHQSEMATSTPAPVQASNPAEAKPADSVTPPSGNEANKAPSKSAKREKTAAANTVEKKSAAETPEAVAAPKTKQQKLADLLERYKADQVTPAQYQEERAKILAEP